MWCFYCDNKAEGYNPYKKVYYCKKHALKKMNDYIEELGAENSTTLKDGFLKVVEKNPSMTNVCIKAKTGEIKDANHNR